MTKDKLPPELIPYEMYYKEFFQIKYLRTDTVCEALRKHRRAKFLLSELYRATAWSEQKLQAQNN